MENNRNPFNVLVGKTISRVVITADSGCTLFFRKVVLAIYNPVIFSPLELERRLVGKTIVSLEISDELFTMSFDQENTLSVQIDDDSYAGPEAMCLQGEGGLLTVWN